MSRLIYISGLGFCSLENMPKGKQINLLPTEEFESSIIGRVLKWAMSTFRIIVIITEMVVMGAFLSRFWLDAQNSDLTESIKIRTAQIEALKDTEDTFRDIQNKLSVFKTIATSPKPSDRIELIATKIPQDIFLTNVSVGDDTVSLKGSSASEVGIAQFVANLKTEKTFKKISLGAVSSAEDNENLTIFNLKISF